MYDLPLIFFATPSQDGKKRLNWNTISNFLDSEQWTEIRKRNNDEIVISLNGFDWLEGDGLTWVLLLVEFLRDNGNTPWVELPRDKRQLTALNSSSFVAVASQICPLSNVFALDGTSVNKATTERFYSISNVNTLADTLRSLFRFFNSEFSNLLNINRLGEIGIEVMPLFTYGISETAKNIVKHSREIDSAGWGYLSVAKVGTKMLRFTVGDVGRGLLASLKSKSIEVHDDTESIRQALLYRYYAKDGEGLFRVSQLVAHQKGAMRIRSGHADAFLHFPKTIPKGDESLKAAITNNLRFMHKQSAFPGVQIMIDVRAV